MRKVILLLMTLSWPVLAISTLKVTPDLSLALYTEEYPPFNYRHEGKITGISTELISEVLSDLNFAGTFEIVPWGRAQKFTQLRANTCFFSAVRTAEREHLYQWVGPLIKEYVQLFSLDQHLHPMNHLAEAKHLRIGGQSADAYTEHGQSVGLTIDLVAEIPVNLERLQLGRIDLWLAGSIGGPFIAARKGLTVYPVASSEQIFELWLACNRDMSPEVIVQLNETLKKKQMHANAYP